MPVPNKMVVRSWSKLDEPLEQLNVILSPGPNGGSPAVVAGNAVVSPHRTAFVMSLHPSVIFCYYMPIVYRLEEYNARAIWSSS